jgi:ADP-ribose pyrophosphatase YjhB (NUDIX family)
MEPDMGAETASIPRVGCGAFILRDGKLLLLKRRRPPEAGAWGQPGGKVEPYETVEDTVRREVMEELGIAIVLERLICVVDQIDIDAHSHWVAPTYLARIETGEPSVQEPEAHSACGWFDLDTLPEPLTVATQQTLAAYLKG